MSTPPESPPGGWKPTPRDAQLNPVPNGQQFPQPPAVTNGSPRSQPVDVLKSINDDVTPYKVRVDDEEFVFNKRLSARQQLAAIGVLADLDEGIQLNAENVERLTGVVEVLKGAVAGMLSDPAGADRLFDILDLEAFTELAGGALEKMTARPTTGSSPSGEPPSTTTSGTGLPAQASTAPISTG